MDQEPFCSHVEDKAVTCFTLLSSHLPVEVGKELNGQKNDKNKATIIHDTSTLRLANMTQIYITKQPPMTYQQ